MTAVESKHKTKKITDHCPGKISGIQMSKIMG